MHDSDDVRSDHNRKTSAFSHMTVLTAELLDGKKANERKHLSPYCNYYLTHHLGNDFKNIMSIIRLFCLVAILSTQTLLCL